MAIDKKSLRSALEELSKLAEQLRSRVNGLSDEQILRGYEFVDRAISDVDRLLATEGEVTAFDDFLHSVGKSVINAQEEIDIESMKYLQGVKNNPYLQPSTFRIPSVKAEMKFALEKTKGKRLGLVFYRRTQQAREQHQQSLSFEIKAVPPPVELIKQVLHDAPGIRVELDPTRRKEILDIVEKVHGVRAPLTNAIDRPRVLIWVPGDDPEYFLFRGTRDKLGVWHLSIKSDRLEDSLVEILPYRVEARHAPLRKWVVKFAEAQVKYFRELG